MKQKFRIASMLMITGMFLSFVPAGAASENDYDNTPPELNAFLLTSALGTRTLEEQPETLDQRQPIKSPNRAFLSSLVVPGSGQLYTGANRGYLYIAAEVVLLATHFITDNSAENLRDDYREQVRQHVKFDGPGTFETWDPIEDYEHATLFDNWHNVYTEDNGEPLERTGEWYWDDRAAFKDDDRKGNDDSPHRLEALGLREDANDKFELARTFLGLVILNHVVSAIDARIATKNYNKKYTPQATLPKPVELELQTTVSSRDVVQSQLVLRKRF